MLVSKIQMQLTSVMIGTEQWKEAKRLARRNRVSAAAVVREALDQYLKQGAAAN